MNKGDDDKRPPTGKTGLVLAAIAVAVIALIVVVVLACGGFLIFFGPQGGPGQP